jgi:uncharacterized protein (TIGR00106 family)
MIIAKRPFLTEGASVGRYVKEAPPGLGAADRDGAMATAIEAPDLASLFAAVAAADEALVRMGARRIHIDLRVDQRLDKDATMASKLAAVKAP